MDDSAEFEDDGEGSFDFARAFSAVRRRWLWIFAATVICAAVASIVTLIMPNKYEAWSVVQIDPRRQPLTNVGVVTEFKADAATIESEVEIVQSRVIARRVIDALDLRDDPEFSGAARGEAAFAPLSWLGSIFGRSSARSAGDAEALEDGHKADVVVDAFLRRLSAERVRTTLLIEIRYWSRDAKKAARIANAIAEVYLSEQLVSKRHTIRVASSLLEEKIEVYKGKVSEAERKVARFKIDYGMFSSEGHVLSEKALARLMEQTINARTNTASTRAKYEQASDLRRSGGGVGALADVLKSHTVRLMKEKLADATRRMAELGTRYGDRHPEMQKVRAEVRDARARLTSEVNKEVAALENAFRQAQLRERELLSDLEKSKASEVGVKEQSAVLKQLEREAKTSRELLEVLLSRFKTATESEDLQIPDARIVEHADVPFDAASPNRTKIIALASGGGLALALLIALALEFATTGLGRPEEAEQVLELKHLSSLPRLYERGNVARDPMLAARLMIADPASAYSEAIRSVRRELDVQSNGRDPRVILVAASLPGEGSSVVASNLAHHYAMTGQEVLLVDGDVRRANLSSQLAPHRRFGLMEALSRAMPVEEAILHDRVTDLNFLPADGGGAVMQSNPELLSSPIMALQMARLKSQFDIIVIDAPPLLPVIDGRVLADHADQILFVMGWRSTPKALAKRALSGLAANERKIAGVVVNQVAPEMLQNTAGFSSHYPGGETPRHRFAA